MTDNHVNNGIEESLETPEVNFKGGTLSINSPVETGNLLDEGGVQPGGAQTNIPIQGSGAGDLQQGQQPQGEYVPGQPILGRPNSAPCSPVIQEGFFAAKVL